jgi:hypothetical protein
MDTHIQIEPTFNAFVKAFGGELIRDIVGPSPNFHDADYLFRKEGVIAELKVLTEDKLNDPEMRKKLGALFQS